MSDIQAKAQGLATFAEKSLDLQTAQLSRAYYYQSLPFCIIDAVFSLGVRYGQVENVMCHVAKTTGWCAFRTYGAKFPAEAEQKTVSELLDELKKHSDPCLTLFKNHGYANPRASKDKRILKSDLSQRFAEVLKENEIETFQDLEGCRDPNGLDSKLCELPALKSGVAVRYFRMLAGDENQVKPDRMIQRFIQTGIGEILNVNDCAKLVQQTARMLGTKFPSLTPRLLDHEIWKFQRNQRKSLMTLSGFCRH